jgi:drug/metabolite transporter (DMT)-like permease
VVAVMLAATILGERLGLVQSIGACLVVGAVVLLGTEHSKRRQPEVAVAP